MSSTINIAVIPGDGIGKEVMPEGMRSLESAGAKHGFDIAWTEFDQHINLRPVRLFDGVPCPLAGRKPGDIDMMIVRENVEGEYSAIGGIQHEGTDDEVVTQQSVFTRHGVDRALKYAFELAQSRPAKHLSSATKANGITHSMPYWDKRVAEDLGKAIAAAI